MDPENELKLKIKKDVKNQVAPEGKKRKRKFFSKILIVALVVWLGYSQYELYIMKNPGYQQKIAEKRNAELMQKVQKLMVLPVGQPQIVLVQDVEMLKKQQQFFKNAMNGDVVLIYTDTAIIYSPSRNKIINVGPVIAEEKNNTQARVQEKAEPSITATTTNKKQ